MTDRPAQQPPNQADQRDEAAEELEEEQHAIELPAREAFSLVFSSPSFLQAGGIVEQILPDEPEPTAPA